MVGSDGVGRLADGRRVFFDATVAPHGAMAERTLVREDALLDVPEGVPDEFAALAPGSIAPMTVFRSKKTDDLPVTGSTR